MPGMLESLHMPRFAWMTRWLLFLAPVLYAQLPKPTPAEAEEAKQIAALPADRVEAAVSGLESARITPGLVQAFTKLGAAAQDPAEQERLARVAVAVAQRGGLGEAEGLAEFALASSLTVQADYYDAVDSWSRAIDKFQEAGSPPSRISGALLNRSIGRLHLGDLTGALEDCQHGLELDRLASDPVRVARALNGLGNIYRELGDFRRSLDAYQESLKLAREKNEKLGEAFVLNNISGMYLDQGDYAKGIEYGLRSLKIKESLGRTNDAISSLANLGDAYDHAGQHAEARRTLDKAVRTAREAGLKTRLAQALKVSARVELGDGHYENGMAQLREARAIFHDTGERLDEADMWADMARAQFARRQYTEAVDAARQARDLAREASGLVVLEGAALVLGQSYHALGKSGDARAALSESIRAVEEIRENVGGADAEREAYLAEHTDAYRELLALDMEEHQTESAFRLAEQAKGRVLLDLLRGGRPPLERVLTAGERQQETGLRGRLTVLRAQRAAAAESHEADSAARIHDLDQRIQKARLELSDFRSALYLAHPDLRGARGDVQPVSVSQAAQLLPGPSAALLEYVVMPRRSYLFVIVRGPAGPVLRAHVLPIGRQRLEAEVVRLRDQIASRDPGFGTIARKLHAWLLEPAARELAGKTAVIIVPDGELWRLPFQALETPTGHFLLEDMALSYAPSLSVMHALRSGRPAQPGHPRSLLVLADPSGDVPQADREAQAIMRLYGGSHSRMWQGPAATSEVFRRQANEFDILHVAAHGVFDDRNPMTSHIVLASPPDHPDDDGWVEAGEVRSMQLKAALVVLSGCETARGHFENGEGAVGLSWAFLAAGARSTVASQWRVESSSTSTIMVAFYEALRQGLGAAEALRQASLKLLATGQFHHPFYWAGFVLLGAP